MSDIYIGADLKDASVTITVNDTAIDWDLYDSVILKVTDRYGRVIAQYQSPDTTDFHKLDLQAGGVAVFDLYKAETADLVPGDVYANITLSQTDADYPLGYKPETRIYLGRAVRWAV